MDRVRELAHALERTPTLIRGLLEPVDADTAHWRESAESWSCYDIVGHLNHGERTDWIPRMRHILEGKPEPFPPFDREAQASECQDLEIRELVDRFEKLRQKNVETLTAEDLSPSDLERTGLHPDFGSVTLDQLLSTWRTHDLSHIAQICRVLARCRSEEIGPWSAYLPIAQPR